MGVPADNRLDDAPMAPVACTRCGAVVDVRKSSWNQTSVQWSTDASARCLQRRDSERLIAGAGRGVFLVCSALRDSIVDAVRRGDLVVVSDE